MRKLVRMLSWAGMHRLGWIVTAYMLKKEARRNIARKNIGIRD